jgi:hypothetical protein
LGQSEILSVQHPPGEPIPEFCQRPKEGSQRPSSVRRQDTGDVFPNKPLRLKYADQTAELQRERTSVALDSGAEAGNREILTRGSSDEDVNRGVVDGVRGVNELSKIAIVRYSGKAVGKQSRSKRIYFAEPRRFPPQRLPCNRCSLNA